MMSELPINYDDVYNHYLNGMTPTEIAEHLKDTLPGLDDVDVEELLLLQESALLYIESNRQKRDIANIHGQTSSRNLVMAQDSRPSHGRRFDSQLVLDEAYARSLALGDDFNNLDVSENGGSTVGITEQSSRGTHVMRQNQNTQQDDIDPDTMTYEELQSLGEAVGSENRGLSADLIARLPTFKYKIGLFSKKKKETEECVICYAEYKNRTQITILPCAHHYHSKCITHWLRMNKTCPVCQKEVQDE